MKSYIYRPGIGLIEVQRAAPQPRVHLITDRAYENLTPVISNLARDKDGNVEVARVDISSRSKHRQYMKENGLALMDDFKETWASAAQERERFATAQQDDKAIREELNRQMYRVFDAPGIEERPKFASAENDPAMQGDVEHPRTPEYPVVQEFLPHGK